MEDQRLPIADILPLNPLCCEPEEVCMIWIRAYRCPFCEKITSGVGFNGISVDEYAIGDGGTLYREFRPAPNEDQDVGCECGRGIWIASRDRCNISTIWSTLSEEQFGPLLGTEFLQ